MLIIQQRHALTFVICIRMTFLCYALVCDIAYMHSHDVLVPCTCLRDMQEESPCAFVPKSQTNSHAEKISVRIRTDVSDKCDYTEHAERISVRIRTEVLISSYGCDMQTSSVCIGTVISKK